MSDDLATLAQLFVDFATASLFAIGGGSAALPELHKVVVTQTHWLTDRQFKEIYSLGQIAPGPNMTMVAVIGSQVAGWAGALVTLTGANLAIERAPARGTRPVRTALTTGR